MTPADLGRIRRMRKHGIVNPILTLRAAREAKLPLALACAFLQQESGGGRNVFGHDKTIFIGAGQVTKEKYLAYKKARKLTGNRKMQGVGPMQLTWWTLQDEADLNGGCWRPYVNMLVGFRKAKALIERNGVRIGIRAYNGSGRAAELYAELVMRHQVEWAEKLKAPRPSLRERALGIALEEAWSGVHEVGGNNRGPRIREYLKEVRLGEGYAWCDAFVSWCLHRAAGGVHIPIESAGVIVTWFAAKRLGWLVSRPLRGDLILFDFDGDRWHDDHIGFIEKVLRLGPVYIIRTIEGNTSSGKKGSQSDGDGVFRRVRTVRARDVAFIRVPGD